MFQLSSSEYQFIRKEVRLVEQIPSSQFVMMGNLPPNRTDKYLPYAFTEQGVTMLSGVIRSTKAISMNITIMRAFVEVRRILLKQTDLKAQLNEIKEKLGAHDSQLNQIYDAMENLIDEKVSKIKWEERERIGFKIKQSD